MLLDIGHIFTMSRPLPNFCHVRYQNIVYCWQMYMCACVLKQTCVLNVFYCYLGRSTLLWLSYLHRIYSFTFTSQNSTSTLRHVRYHHSLAASSFRCLPGKWLSIILKSLRHVLYHIPQITVMAHNTWSISS